MSGKRLPHWIKVELCMRVAPLKTILSSCFAESSSQRVASRQASSALTCTKETKGGKCYILTRAKASFKGQDSCLRCFSSTLQRLWFLEAMWSHQPSKVYSSPRQGGRMVSLTFTGFLSQTLPSNELIQEIAQTQPRQRSIRGTLCQEKLAQMWVSRLTMIQKTSFKLTFIAISSQFAKKLPNLIFYSSERRKKLKLHLKISIKNTFLFS